MGRIRSGARMCAVGKEYGSAGDREGEAAGEAAVAKTTEGIVRLEIDEHLARVEARSVELRGEHMATLLRRVLQALGHDPGRADQPLLEKRRLLTGRTRSTTRQTSPGRADQPLLEKRRLLTG